MKKKVIEEVQENKDKDKKDSFIKCNENNILKFNNKNFKKNENIYDNLKEEKDNNLFNFLNDEQRSICDILNYKNPTDIQNLIIKELYCQTDNNLCDKNLIIKNRAGSGKTFAFILSILKNFDFNSSNLQSIIILPTRELALQTSEYFDKINNFKFSDNQKKLTIKYEILIGGNIDINNIKSKKIDKNKIKEDTQIIIGTIGKFYSYFAQKNLMKNLFFNLKVVVIDEADKIIFQNKNDILKKILSKFKEISNFNKNNLKKNHINFILVSASIEERTKRFFADILNKKFRVLNPNSINDYQISNKKLNDNNFEVGIDEKFEFKNNSLSTIKEYYYIFKNEERTSYFENKYSKLLYILNSLKDKFKQSLIFYNQKGKGEELASDLRDQGWLATTFIHGDLNQDQRVLLYKKIKNLEIKLIISTDLFSRGIDLRNVDLVINFDCPFNKIEYHHRVGRTGRFNTLGNSITFFQENQIYLMNEIKNEEVNKLIEIKDINEEFIINLIEDYREINKTNPTDNETSKKINIINSMFQNNDLKLDYENENLLKNKRRKIKYEKESLISNWVETEKKLFDETNFLYLQDIVINNEKEAKKSCHEKKKFCLYCNLFKIIENNNC